MNRIPTRVLMLLRAARLLLKGLDKPFERYLEMLEAYSHYLEKRNLRPEDDARSIFYQGARDGT